MRRFPSLSAAITLTAASVASAATVSITDLGGLGGSLGSRGFAVGPTTVVAGTSYLPGNATMAGLNSTAGTPVLHDTYAISSNVSYGLGIGGSTGDTFVGFSLTGTGRGVTHAISGSAGSTSDLHSAIATGPFASSSNSRAFAINDLNAIVGQASSGSNYQAFYLPSAGSPTAIPIHAGYTSSLATAVNHAGVVVGFDYTGNWSFSLEGSVGGLATHPAAFVYDGSSSTPLGTLGGTDSIATAINAAGAIVGQSTSSASDLLEGKGHAFLYSAGSMTALTEAPGAVRSIADDINDAGDIVGSYLTPSGAKAFIYHNNAMLDLNSFLPQSSGWVLKEANSINQDGYITGYGTLNGNTTAFLLAPLGLSAVAPEPTAAMLAGLTAFLALAKRKH